MTAALVRNGYAGADLIKMYEEQELSLSKISKRTGIAISTVRAMILRSGGIMRTTDDGVRNHFKHHASALKGTKRGPMSEERKKKISKAHLRRADRCAKGVSHKTNGYVQYTRGENKHRSVHVVMMEDRIGRKLKPDECVHHIDGNRHNNSENNLALMTTSAHARLHRFEDKLAGNNRERSKDGRFI